MGLFKTPERAWYAASPAADPALALTYLGTAGFVLHDGERTLVLDPYVTRTGLLATLTRPLVSDAERVRRLLPRADDVLVGHAHYDHILDAPELCRHTGARLAGSRATMMVGRAAGVPADQLLELGGAAEFASGAWRVRALPSLHGKALLGRVPLPGDITEPPPWPPRVHQLRHGLVLSWLVDTGRVRLLHIDSAEFVRAELLDARADVLCLCAIGWRYRPRYVSEVIELVRPRWVVPCHWDTMITPIESEPELLPTVDLPGFLAAIRAAGCEPLLMPLLGTLGFPACR